jgi:ankyrin repeat protein
MMKYALARAREEITDCVIISFFFNARGEALEKSTLGMYRSLLFQLLNAIPVLQDDFIASAYTRQKYGRLREWNTEELKNLLASAVGSLKQQRLACFIDALDECDEDQVRDMVEFLERLGRDTLVNGIGLYVYLSSRHYPHISIKKGKELIMEGQLGHNQDIKKYVESKLNAGSGTLVEEVKAEILERASGVFLWVVLVVQMLNQAYDHGQIYALRKRLREIPTDLDDLFVDILTRDNKNKEELILCLQWILYAQRPLKRAELYFAIISGIETAELMEWNPREVATQDMERFILSCSKGLAETTKTNDRTVQFIHESVRDFLLWRNGLARLQSDLGHNIAGLSHNRLKGCCLRYMEMDMSQQMQKPLSTKALRDLVSRKFPFLEYAVRNLLIHADAAEGYGVSQTDFLARFTSHSWALYPSCGFRILINFDNLLERYKIRHHTAEVTLLYFLAENNLSNLITLHLERDADIDHLGGERYFTPVYAAVVCGQEQALRALLAIDNETSNDHSQHNDKLIPSRTKVHEEGIQFLMQRRQDFASQTCQTLLSSATRLGFESVVKLLLATGKIDVNAVDKDGRTPLSLAAGTKYDGTVKLRGVVKLLLAADNVDINSTDVEGRTALWWAAHADQVYMARLLLDTGRIDLTSKVNFDINMLFQAITQKDDIIAKMLLTMSDVNRKDLNLRNAFGQTPLSAAAQWGCHGIVKLLLATGLVDTDAWDSQGLTPLQLARNWRRDTTVELLEDYQRKKQLSEPKS